MQSYVDFFKQHGVRVVNMSWGGSVKGFEEALEQCGIGKTVDERKALAREYFEIQKNALTKAIASAPGHPVRHRSGKLQRQRVVRRGHPGGHRAAEPDRGRRGRQRGRRGELHELRPDGGRAMRTATRLKA